MHALRITGYMSGYYHYYGPGGGPRHSRYFECEPSDQKLSDCTNHSDTSPRLLSQDAGVSCSPCTPIKLMAKKH